MAEFPRAAEISEKIFYRVEALEAYLSLVSDRWSSGLSHWSDWTHPPSKSITSLVLRCVMTIVQLLYWTSSTGHYQWSGWTPPPPPIKISYQSNDKMCDDHCPASVLDIIHWSLSMVRLDTPPPPIKISYQSSDEMHDDHCPVSAVDIIQDTLGQPRRNHGYL